jgi:hypothetical protein
MTLDEFAEWCQRTPVGHSLRSVVWEHPVVEIVHYAGLVLVFGPVLVVNLRLLGFVLRGVPLVDVADGVARWRNSGLVLLFTSGPLLFLANAIKVFSTWFFAVKMILLVAALVLQFRVHEKVTHASIGSVSASKIRLVAVASVSLWLGVAVAGMALGLFD